MSGGLVSEMPYIPPRPLDGPNSPWGHIQASCDSKIVTRNIASPISSRTTTGFGTSSPFGFGINAVAAATSVLDRS
jgi:hypothetical protein